MKRFLLASALAAGAALGLHGITSAHGGTYRGPGDTVPPGGGGGGGGGPASPGPSGPSTPGGGGPATPGPSMPGTPGGGPGLSPTAPTTGGGGGGGPDLTAWTFWWEFNKEPYLNLKSAVHQGVVQTGSDQWFLGRGQQTDARDTYRPSEEQIRQKVVPAMLAALENESNNDIVTGAMMALAKIGDEKTEGGESQFQPVIAKRLADSNQEISETSALALGILANEQSIPLLASLMKDEPVEGANGRAAVGRNEVPLRTRAFGAYGLALVGHRAAAEETRRRVVRHLADVLDSAKLPQRDVHVGALIGIGLVPLSEFGELSSPPENGRSRNAAPIDPSLGLKAQIEYVLRYFENEDNHYLIRAHAPAALARLLEKVPKEEAPGYKERIANALLSRLGKRSKAQNEIVQSCVLALGQIGDRDEDRLDQEIRKVLVSVPEDVSDQQARNFSLIALGQVGGRAGDGEQPKRGDEISRHLQRQLSDGKSSVQSWAGLAIGVMGHAMVQAQEPIPTDSVLALRSAFQGEKQPSRFGAWAIALGILNDADSAKVLKEKLHSTRDEEAQGYVSVALGLMNARDAMADIQKLIRESKYKPELLQQAAIGLGLLGDKEIVTTLLEMLQDATGLASQAALASALGFIGDSRSIDPLVAMLQDQGISATARGFAAVALGIVADKELLPWNSKIAVNLNYRATTETLNDTQGTGILNIL